LSEIRVLPGEVINQIAAGEVVERPASVVKELVENALDAEAGDVRIAIRGGGIDWIRVLDDGCGMSPADARLAFVRHATSKIREAADLERVGSLGFRGEALPSIASVARVRMRTRRPQDALGLELEGEGRGIERVREIACAAGTRVEVAELFRDLPARRKFLKSPTTEASHILRWLERMALARCDVRFELERDDRACALFLPTSDPRERAVAVLPAGIGERLLPVEGELPWVRLRGLASPTDLMRGASDDIHVFVNGRPVRDRLLLFAVREAYRDALPTGRHPVVVLFAQVDPGEVDVNVHPAKTEVRFRDSRAITGLIRSALRGGVGLRPRSSAAVPAGWAGQGAGSSAGYGLFADASDPAPVQWSAAAPDAGGPGTGALDSREPARTGWGAASDRAYAPPASFAALRYVGQVLGGYLVLEDAHRVLILDQHAAHERVLFERLWQSARQGKVERQTLLTPEWIELEHSAADALLAHRERLERAGFEVEPGPPSLGARARLCLRAVPALGAGRPADWQALLAQTAATLRDPQAGEVRDGLEGRLHQILATSACHAAVRQGDRLDAREVVALLRGLDEAAWFANCPHGRPIAASLERSELERRLLRR
jgi:DNA mismatch repair protein MutL